VQKKSKHFFENDKNRKCNKIELFFSETNFNESPINKHFFIQNLVNVKKFGLKYEYIKNPL
jgi:hypothetical protein